MNKKFFLGTLIAFCLIVIFVFVPLNPENQAFYANWASLYNNTNNLSTLSNGVVCPGYSACKAAPTIFEVPSGVSVTYYFWRFGGDLLLGNMAVLANGSVFTGEPILGASTYARAQSIKDLSEKLE